MKTNTRRTSITTDSVRHVVRWKDNRPAHSPTPIPVLTVHGAAVESKFLAVEGQVIEMTVLREEYMMKRVSLLLVLVAQWGLSLWPAGLRRM